MNQRLRLNRWASLVFAAVLMVVAAPASPDNAAAKQKQLDALKARLTRVEADRDAELKRRGALQTDLRQNERGIARLSRQVADLDRQMAPAQARLDELRRQQAGHQATLDTQKAALSAQMQAAFMEGRDSQLRLLLDAQDPATVGRLLAYYDYLNRARAARIVAVRSELTKLAALDAQIGQQVAGLKSLRDSRGQTLVDLQQQDASRRRLIAEIDASIKSRDAEIARLKRDQQALQALVDELRQALADIPADLGQGRRFSGLRGRLLWPVNGRLVSHYGQPRAGGHMRWEGDLIAAPVGTPVRAVSYGRVVYADWMPHFGLLVILDHGDGYLSIYAHNQSIDHQVGDWVQAGETIAALGESGGQEQPALYFELRHGKDTLDPRRWCRGRLPAG
ncbi:MAG TPA: peptidoglycan DD-metalloendopeptidase family protein [Gammaproteobacteria bacterium]|nr:peptidoglycan DD-metalloendopeptidase family protein [Gammaproteobacteria bacterium]